MIDINKEINNSKEKFIINYIADNKGNEYLTKKELILTSYLNDYNHNFMINNVEVIRTIFNDFEEKYLYIYYSNFNDVKIVKYENKKLVYYEEENNKFNLKYSLQGKINYSYYENDNLITENLSKVMSNIIYLSNVRAYKLTENDKILIKIYKLFYNESPDFSSKEINKKIQVMMSILSLFNITLPYDYGFTLYNEMPISLDLNMQVNRLYPFGKTFCDDILLTSDATKTIKIVGKCINEYASCLEDLIKISKVIYISRYRLASNSDISKIADVSKVKESDVLLCKSLIRKIESENI